MVVVENESSTTRPPRFTTSSPTPDEDGAVRSRRASQELAAGATPNRSRRASQELQPPLDGDAAPAEEAPQPLTEHEAELYADIDRDYEAEIEQKNAELLQFEFRLHEADAAKHEADAKLRELRASEVKLREAHMSEVKHYKGLLAQARRRLSTKEDECSRLQLEQMALGRVRPLLVEASDAVSELLIAVRSGHPLDEEVLARGEVVVAAAAAEGKVRRSVRVDARQRGVRKQSGP